MSDTSPATAAYFVRTGTHRFLPTPHTGGAWSDDEQHVSPLVGLLVHEIERVRAARQRPRLLLGRGSIDILGRIGQEEFTIDVDTSRPGRTIELTEATVTIAGRPVARARAWYLVAGDTSAVAGGAPEPLPPPDSLRPWSMSELWPGGYIASLDVRPIGPRRPGRATAWVSSPIPLLADEEVGTLASYLALVDTANGIAVRRDPREWMFPNVDLTFHLHRQPEGPWTGLDTTVVFGTSGHGVTSTVLHDVRGSVGSAQQLLTVRPLPGD